MTTSDKIYLSLCTLFSAIIIMGNLIYQKIISLSLFSFYTLELSVGAILYPFTFILTNLISEFYGREKTKFCIRLMITLNIIVAFIISGMDCLDATQWSRVNTETFHKVFGQYYLALLGSMIACYIGQRLDVSLYLWIRRITGEKWLWIRSNGSTALALLVDTCIVISLLAIFGVLPQERIGIMIANTYFYKFLFTICSTPLFYLGYRIIQLLLSDSNFASLPIDSPSKKVQNLAA